MEDNLLKKEYWWEFLKNNLKKKMRNNLPLETITGVKNKILEVGEDFFVVKSERGKENRKITKERVEKVLQLVITKGYYDVYVEDMSKEFLTLKDGSNLSGAHTAIIRGLLTELPFVTADEKSAQKIILVRALYEKAKWGIEPM